MLLTLAQLSPIWIVGLPIISVIGLGMAITFLKFACSTTGYSSPSFYTTLGVVIIHAIIFSSILGLAIFILDETNTRYHPTYQFVIATLPAFLISLIALTFCLRFLLVVRITQAAVPALAYMVIWYVLVIPIYLLFFQ